MKNVLLLPLLLLALASWSPAPASEDRFEADTYGAESDRAVKTLVEELEDVAKWCKRKRLYLERDRIFEKILEFDTDHADAREALNYKQRSDGSWYRAKPYRAPRNYDESKVPEAEAKRAEAVRGYRDEILRLLDKHEDSLSSATRNAELQKLLVLDPKDEEVHKRLGRVSVGGGEDFVMPESKAALEQRARIRELVVRSLDAAPEPQKFEPDEWEDELGVKWRSCVKTSRIRILCTGDAEEATKAARVVHACSDYFNGMFDADVRHPLGFRMYVLSRDGEQNRFLARHPSVTDADRKRYERLSGAWVNSNLVEWADAQETRLDGMVRQTLGTFFNHYYGVTAKQGWIWEGFGMYLTYQLVGTRLTYFVRQSEYVEGGRSLRERLQRSNANWLGEARRLLKGEVPPQLAFLLGRDVNAMTQEDAVVAYALAAFLIEGNPEVAAEVVSRVGGGETPGVVLEEALGYDLPALQKRLLAWLEEVS